MWPLLFHPQRDACALRERDFSVAESQEESTVACGIGAERCDRPVFVGDEFLGELCDCAHNKHRTIFIINTEYVKRQFGCLTFFVTLFGKSPCFSSLDGREGLGCATCVRQAYVIRTMHTKNACKAYAKRTHNVSMFGKRCTLFKVAARLHGVFFRARKRVMANFSLANLSLKDEASVRRFLHVAPSAILFSAARPVARFDGALHDLVSEMYRIMYDKRGVGLAAPQVGEAVRVVVIDLQGRSMRKEKEKESEKESKQPAEEVSAEEEFEDDCLAARQPFTLVNPEIVRSSEDRRVYEEGCLSFPDLLVEIERPREVEVRYQNVEGRECFVKADGLLSVCLQHEIDHLEGRTIVDSLSRLKRSMVLRRFAKQARQAQLEGGR